MANTIKLRRSATPSAVPTTTQLDLGEIGINTWDGKVFIKRNNGTESIVEIGAGGGGGGISSVNALTASTQTFATGTSGTDFAISSSTSTHTFNIPSASATARGLVTTSAQTFQGTKTVQSDAAGNKALIAKAAASQTANILETQNSSGTTLSYVSSSGLFFPYLGYVNNVYVGTRNANRNVYLGERAGESNAAAAQDNTGMGLEALRYNTSGYENTAMGKSALGAANSTAIRNTAIGMSAGSAITSGGSNVFIGHLAGTSMTTGGSNVLIGASATGSITASSQIAIGASATCSGASALAIGTSSSAAANCMDIRFGGATRISGDSSGNVSIAAGLGVAGALSANCAFSVTTGYADALDYRVGASELSSGNFYFAAKLVSRHTTTSAANVYVDATNHVLVRSTSSQEYKTEIEDIDPAFADKLLEFRPVWFRSTANLDIASHSHFGFIAEEIAAIEPRYAFWKYDDDDVQYIDIVNSDGTTRSQRDIKAGAIGKPVGVQYDRIVASLTSVVQRMKATMEDQAARLAALEALMAAQ